MKADILTRLQELQEDLLADEDNCIPFDCIDDAINEILAYRAEVAIDAEELARLRERVTMLVEAAAEDARRAARLERVITNKEPLL
jgi:hypothetical protein